MKFLMRKCTKCGRYTLKDACPVCGSPTVSPHPAKFSPDDKYAKYRVEGVLPEKENLHGASSQEGSGSDEAVQN